MMLMKFYEKRKKEKQRKLKIKTAKKILIGTAAGSIGGLVGGLLFSPKSGKETRKDIGNVSKNIKHKTEELKETIDNKVSTVKDSASDAKMRFKQKTEEIKENINDKVTDVKDGVAEAKIKISEYLNEKKASKIATDSEDSSCIEEQDNINECEIKEMEVK